MRKSDDLISRQAAIDAVEKESQIDGAYGYMDTKSIVDLLCELPSAQPEIIRCKDCKHFELNHFEKVEEFPVPIIVAHEICMKWSDGCRTSKDGWCFMAERRTDE